MDAKTRNGYLFALLAVLCFAFLPLFTKLIYLHSDLRGIDIAVWRFGLAVPILWVLLTLRSRSGQDPHQDEQLPRFKLMLLGVILASGALAAFYGLSIVDASVYSLLFRTQPILVLVLNALLGERFPMRGWVALLVTTVGVVFMVGDPEAFAAAVAATGESNVYLIGIFIALGNALAIAFYHIGQERVMTAFSNKLRATAWTISGTLLTVLPIALFTGVRVPPNWPTWAALVGMGTIVTIMPMFALYESIGRIGSSRVSIMGAIEPVLTVIMAIVFLSEPMFTPLQLAGSALILSSIFILNANYIHFPWQRQHNRGTAYASGD
ncbi:MAG: DMT family transporter [Chloroflexota bacterium]